MLGQILMQNLFPKYIPLTLQKVNTYWLLFFPLKRKEIPALSPKAA